MKEKTNKSVLKKILIGFGIVFVTAALFALVSNLIVRLSVKGRMRSVEESAEKSGYDCILVLGCGVWEETPSPLLSDRLDAAVKLYHAGAAPKVLVSGDHGRKDYNEVSVMRKYLIDRGVPSEDVFMDHAGFSTYETMYRASDVFGVRKALVVTQEYHLYRALYDASAFGIEADGAMATGHVFASQTLWNMREAVARVKDFIWCIFKPEPTYRGEKIDIHGNGEVTLD